MKRFFLLLPLLLAPVIAAEGATALPPPATFEVRFANAVRGTPVTGRAFVAITRDGATEPRLQVAELTGPPFFGVDVLALRPGDPARITRATGLSALHPRRPSPGGLLGPGAALRLQRVPSCRRPHPLAA